MAAAITLHPACRVIFCVPVYDEDTQSIMRLLLSLARQAVPAFTITAIVVVNNRPPAGQSWKTAYLRNQAILRLPAFYNAQPSATPETPESTEIRSRITAYVVDRSSPGEWIEECNVGKARGVGLALTVRLFQGAGRNGIAVHTDADCWYEDSQFASKLLWLFKKDPLLLGIAGANYQQIDPLDPEASELARHLEAYIRYRRYRALALSVQNNCVRFDGRKTLGRCIAHRAIEGQLAGGFAPIPFAEDIDFGNKLRAYGNAKGMRFEHGRKWGLGPISALRASDRTPNSIRRDFLDHITRHGEIEVDDVLAPPRRIILTDAYLDRLADIVSQLPGGDAQLEYLYVTSSLATIRVKQ